MITGSARPCIKASMWRVSRLVRKSCTISSTTIPAFPTEWQLCERSTCVGLNDNQVSINTTHRDRPYWPMRLRILGPRQFAEPADIRYRGWRQNARNGRSFIALYSTASVKNPQTGERRKSQDRHHAQAGRCGHTQSKRCGQCGDGIRSGQLRGCR